MSSLPSSFSGPLRVLLDVRILQGEDAFRGIGHYTRGLTEALLALIHRGGSTSDATPCVEAHLVVDEERPPPSLDTAGAAAVHAIASPAPRPTRFPARWFVRGTTDVRAMARLARRLRAHVVHYASPLHGPFNWNVSPGAATVATLYDLIPLLDREHYLDAWPADLACRYQERLKMLPGLSGIVAISATAAGDATRLLGIDSNRIRVAYPALRSPFRCSGQHPRADATDARPYLMAFASLNPSKHTDLLTEAYAGLDHAVREAHPLRLVGPDEPDLMA